MKTSYKYLAIAFATFLCSCNEGITPDMFESQVQISANITPRVLTRVTEDGKSFTDGDVIKVQNINRENKNLATYTYSENIGKWNTSDELYWEGESENTFHAWYPATAGYDSFDIPSDQTSGIDDADWMTATASAKKADGIINLSFNRNLAKVTVTIDSWSNEYSANERVANSLELNSLSSVMSYDGTLSGDNVTKWVKAYIAQANTSFVAIIAPATYASGDDIMQIYVNASSTPLTVKTSSDIKIEAGKAYSFKLAVGKDLAYITSSVTIGEWDDVALDDQGSEDIIYRLSEGSSLNYTLQFSSGDIAIPLQSNIGTDITISYDGPESGWITYDKDLAISSIINELVFNVTSNKGASTRTARIHLSNPYVSESITLNVNQEPFVGLDDSNLDKGKYITYVEDYEYVGKGDAFDYDMYYYGTTIYSRGLAMSSKIECKFSLNSFTEGNFYISVGEYDDSIYEIYLNTNGLNIGSKCYTWSDLGVSETSIITLTLSGTTMIVNGKTIEGIPAVGHYLEGYIWSGHYHERDDGMWWMDYTFQNGGRIYYAKGWDSDGQLIYIGGAALSNDGRACWKSVYYDSYSGDMVTQEHFPRVTSSFGRGNL